MKYDIVPPVGNKQMKPKRDPWQQRQMAKLKELRSMDELLQMHAKFLEVNGTLANALNLLSGFLWLMLVLVQSHMQFVTHCFALSFEGVRSS